MSIFKPKWMNSTSFYPTWMGGGIEVEVEISGGSGSQFYEYSSSEVFKLFVHSIEIIQEKEEPKSVLNYISNLIVHKIKNIPTIKTKKITFVEL